MPPVYYTQILVTQDKDLVLSNDSPYNMLRDENVQKVIGRGISNPFQFSSDNKNLELVRQAHGVQKINNSLRDILNTLCYNPMDDTGGECFKIPTYGCGLRRMIMEPVDPETGIWAAEARSHIDTAISEWEKRIRVNSIQFIYTYLANHIVYIPIHYLIFSTSQPGSYVHPFVLGTFPAL